MNDGQHDMLAELKKIREENSVQIEMLTEMRKSKNDNAGMHANLLSELSDSSAKSQTNDSCELLNELCAMRLEMKQLKEQYEEQKTAYVEVCEKLEATEQKMQLEMEQLKKQQTKQEEAHVEMKKELEDQKNAYEEVCKKLNEEKKQKEKYEKVFETEQQKVQLEMQSEMRKLKSELREQTVELAALKINHDDTSILEMKKKQEAHDLKLQQHESDLKNRKVVSFLEQLAGEWHLLACDGNKERYETYTTIGVQKVNFDVLDFQVLPDKTICVLTDGVYNDSLSNLFAEEDYLGKEIRTDNYCQAVTFSIRNSHLVVTVGVKKRDAACSEFIGKFLYGRD